MKFKCNYRRPKLDLSGYKKALDKYMRELLAQGLAAWLDAVIAEVPLWSGASRATFIKVAKEIDWPVAAEGNRTGMGVAASTGKLVADIGKGSYMFTYGTTLPWLVWNEYHNANIDPDPTKWPPPAKLHKPGPYNFQVKGMAAFLHVADTVELPYVGPFVKGVAVRK